MGSLVISPAQIVSICAGENQAKVQALTLTVEKLESTPTAPSLFVCEAHQLNVELCACVSSYYASSYY
jgi:hypothetical protein